MFRSAMNMIIACTLFFATHGIAISAESKSDINTYPICPTNVKALAELKAHFKKIDTILHDLSTSKAVAPEKMSNTLYYLLYHRAMVGIDSFYTSGHGLLTMAMLAAEKGCKLTPTSKELISTYLARIRKQLTQITDDLNQAMEGTGDLYLLTELGELRNTLRKAQEALEN